VSNPAPSNPAPSNPTPSNPTASNPIPSSQRRTDPKIGLTFTMTHKLAALFTSSAIDIHLAWQMAVSAIEAYRPETRADYVNVARTIAFSMSAITLLGDAAAKNLTLPDKMRLFARANALDRSADQSERTMMQRQRHHRANPRADYATNFHPAREPEAPDATLAEAVPEAAVTEAAVAEAMAAWRAALNEISATAAPTAPAAQSPAEPRPLSVNRPAQPPAPPQTCTPQTPTPQAAAAAAATQAAAIRYDGPQPVPAQTRPVPRKQELLRHTAMQRVVDHLGPIQPGPIHPGPTHPAQNQPASLPPAPAAHRRSEPPASHTTTP